MSKRRYEDPGLDLKIISQDLTPVMKLMADGYNPTDAFASVAKQRYVSPYTVYENCTRRLGLTTSQFVVIVESGTMKEYLLKHFPYDAYLLEGVNLSDSHSAT